MDQRLSSAQQHLLLVASMRATVVAVQILWLLDVSASGPAAPLVAAWLVVSVLVVAVAAARREPWPRTEPAVAAVDVVAVVSVTLTAPSGYLSVALLGLVVLVQVPLRWGPAPAVAVGALLSVVGVQHPPPDLVSLGGGAAVVAVDAFRVALALLVRSVRAAGRAGRARRGHLGDHLRALTGRGGPDRSRREAAHGRPDPGPLVLRHAAGPGRPAPVRPGPPR